MKKMIQRPKLEEIHNCEKCRGKIVLISIDYLGVTRCGYCNSVVNYQNVYKDDFIKFINTTKRRQQNGRQ